MSILFENTALPDILELRKVSQSYDNGKTFVIKDLDFLIEDKPQQGQFVSLLGPSGCGKSTLLRYFAGLQTPTSGEVLLYGKSRTNKDRVGMIFQKYSSFPWLTVLENVELGLKIKEGTNGIDKKMRKELAMNMLSAVGLADQHWKYAQYPTLSGGQLQRVAIARSLLASPKVLLMDEPFGALDIKTRLQVQDMLNQLWLRLSLQEEQTTMVMVTHDIPEAVYLSDEVIIMSNAPAQIIHRIKIELPIERKPEMKKMTYFKEMVSYITDIMMNLQTMQ